jgi:hypothetical protein
VLLSFFIDLLLRSIFIVAFFFVFVLSPVFLHSMEDFNEWLDVPADDTYVSSKLSMNSDFSRIDLSDEEDNLRMSGLSGPSDDEMASSSSSNHPMDLGKEEEGSQRLPGSVVDGKISTSGNNNTVAEPVRAQLPHVLVPFVFLFLVHMFELQEHDGLDASVY